MMLDIVGWVAALVAAITGLAMLQDVHRRPPDTSPRGWCRHVMRLGLLIGITAAAAVLTVMPEARTASVYEIALRCCLTGVLVMSSPCPWWRYVFLGAPAARIDRRRSLT
jgi:hypothetical protein